MPAMNIPMHFVKRASSDKNSLYIALAIVFGAIGLVCLLITVYLMSRLRRNDRKLDRELAQNTYDNKEFAPQFREKNYHEDYPRPPVPPPSLPVDIIQSGHPMPMPHVQGPVPPSPTPMRPVRRPSSLFDRRRASGSGGQRMADPFADQHQQDEHYNSAAAYMPPVWQAPTHQRQDQSVDLHITAPDAVALADEDLQPPRMGHQQDRPESAFSIYSAYGNGATTAGTEAPPLQNRSQVGRSSSFHRSPSLLRQLLADRAAKAGMVPPPPPPPMPPMPKPQPPRLVRPETALNTGLMPYDLETATPGPTPIDVPPASAMSTATHVIDQRLEAYGHTNGNGTLISMRSIREDDEDPFADADGEDPHSAARMTLLQPPASPPRRSPPPLTITIPNSHTKGMLGNGVPLVGPSHAVAPVPAQVIVAPATTNNAKGFKAPRKPVMQRPPPPPMYHTSSHASNNSGSGPDLANFAARLRPDTRDFNAEPVAIPDERDGGDFRITMRP